MSADSITRPICLLFLPINRLRGRRPRWPLLAPAAPRVSLPPAPARYFRARAGARHPGRSSPAARRKKTPAAPDDVPLAPRVSVNERVRFGPPQLEPGPPPRAGSRVAGGDRNCLRPDLGGQEEQTREARGRVGSVLTELGSPGSASSGTGPTGGRMSRNPTGRRAPPQSAWSFDSVTSFVASHGSHQRGRIGQVLIRFFGWGALAHRPVPKPYKPKSGRAMAPSYRRRCGGPLTS